MHNLRFLKIGSDPELVFTRVQEWRPFIVPASDIISGNRALATHTFIGTDGHPATAELRPPPCHNVWRHLYDISSAIDTIHSYVKEKPKIADVQMMAQPVINGEPLGGHIHCSFLINDPMTALAISLNRIYGSREGIVAIDNNRNVDITDTQSRKLNEYSKLAQGEKIICPAMFGKTMSFLIQPLEWWLQPWFSRVDRNARYGRGEDMVRWQRSPRPTTSSIFTSDKWAYLHYEYRVPSTWLCHPWLAYAYLACAKLTMLNWDIIREHINSGKYAPIPSIGRNDIAYNKELRDVFHKRLKTISMSKGYRESNDLTSIEKASRLADENREKWFSPTSMVDVSAWRNLI